MGQSLLIVSLRGTVNAQTDSSGALVSAEMLGGYATPVMMGSGIVRPRKSIRRRGMGPAERCDMQWCEHMTNLRAGV